MNRGFNQGSSFGPNSPQMDSNLVEFRSPPSPNVMNLRFSSNRSPRFAQQTYRSPSNTPPFRYPPYYSTPNQCQNSSLSEQWSMKTNNSYGSNSSNSGSYRSDGSPYNHRLSAGYSKGRRQFFRSPASNDSNPGHTPDVKKYVHPSMLEDPWKELLENQEKYKP